MTKSSMDRVRAFSLSFNLASISWCRGEGGREGEPFGEGLLLHVNPLLLNRQHVHGEDMPGPIGKARFKIHGRLPNRGSGDGAFDNRETMQGRGLLLFLRRRSPEQRTRSELVQSQ